MEIYHLTKQFDDRLFDQFYSELVIPYFPQISEVIPFDIWKDWVKNPDLAPLHIEVYLAGENFDTNSPILFGFSHFEWYRDSKCALAGYASVVPTHRGKGISSTLLNLGIKEMQEKGARAVFGEINDPARTVEDSMDPLLRLKVWQNVGMRRIDTPYYQPSLGDDQDIADNLWLCLLPIPGIDITSIQRNIVSDFLIEMFGTLQIENPANAVNALLGDKSDILQTFDLIQNSIS